MNPPRSIEETVLLPAAQTAETRGDAGVRLAGDSAPAMHEETAETLRRRLRVVAAMLVVGLSLFLLRGFLRGDTWMQAIRIVVFIVTLTCVFATSPRRGAALRRLRMVEVVLFGLVGLQLVAVQITQTLAAIVNNDSNAITGSTLFSFAAWIFLVMTYGMFIPNTWRRALLFVVPACVAAPAITIILSASYEVVRGAVSVGPVIAASLLTAISAMFAVLGAQVVHSLRREAFEARQYGQYHLKEKLGSGGMGEVYLAEHHLLKRPSAIKLIRPSIDHHPDVIERFEAEVQATATLSHWNTVEIFDYGRTDDGTFYYVMEYLPGLNLEEIVKQFGPMPAARVVHFLRQLCGALEEAHSIGLIHRDIKPANVIAAHRGGVFDVAKLVDFGIARQTRVEGDAQELTVAGSPLFMSPEHAAAPETVDGRSDLYSLGVTGYFLLTGRYPFDADQTLAVIKAHAQQSVPALSEGNSQVPAELERIIHCCLEKRLRDRYQSAAEMRDALSSCEADWTADDAARWWREYAPSNPV